MVGAGALTFRFWAGRLSLIPLAVYALGTPLELLYHGSVLLHADGWLPYEVVGLSVALAIAVVIGIVWTVLYYGGLSPMFTNLPNQYPGAYNTRTFAFVEDFALFWTALVTFALVVWLWNQSQKDYQR